MGAQPMFRHTSKVTATITNGTALSGVIPIGPYAFTALFLPAAWTAAAITFDGSADGGLTWAPVYGDDGTEVSIASGSVVAGRVIVNKAVLEQLAVLTHIRLRSGTSGLPVNQGADRVFTIQLKG